MRRSALLALLATRAHPDLADAVASARARNLLLQDRPSTTDAAEFLHVGIDLEGVVPAALPSAVDWLLAR